MPSQSWKRQLKRLTTAVFIGWSVFCESVSKGSCKDDVIIYFLLNSWRFPLRERLVFCTHITFNQFYCFAKFQCDDIIFVHFTDQNSFQGPRGFYNRFHMSN